MKLLNSSAVQNLAKDGSYPCTVESFLWHWTRGDEKHRRQYFVLKANLLFSFSRKSDKLASALWILDGYVLKLEEQQNSLCFVLATSDGDEQAQDDFFMASSVADMHKWIVALSSTSYEQLTLTASCLDLHLRSFIRSGGESDETLTGVEEEEEEEEDDDDDDETDDDGKEDEKSESAFIPARRESPRSSSSVKDVGHRSEVVDGQQA